MTSLRSILALRLLSGNLLLELLSLKEKQKLSNS